MPVCRDSGWVPWIGAWGRGLAHGVSGSRPGQALGSEWPTAGLREDAERAREPLAAFAQAFGARFHVAWGPASGSLEVTCPHSHVAWGSGDESHRGSRRYRRTHPRIAARGRVLHGARQGSESNGRNTRVLTLQGVLATNRSWHRRHSWRPRNAWVLPIGPGWAERQ